MTLTTELKETLTFILAGGKGKRLAPLTLPRAKPAVPFGGSYRIIDFTLSNCIHSGLRRIHVLTQYHARSLDEHIRFGWNFLPRRLEQFISVRPPHHKREERWYAGTADAIYQNLDAFTEDHCNHVLILSGDHIYRMNYAEMLREHLERGSAATIGAVRIPASESASFGILQCDENDRVTAFQEKPEHGVEIPAEPGWCLGSMGIYIFTREELLRRLCEDAELGDASSHDFGNDILPRMIDDVPVHAHRFTSPGAGPEPYWRDVGSLDAYFDANMDLCRVEPQFNLYDHDWPVYTLWHNDPPAKTVYAGSNGDKAHVLDSLLCPGVVVSGAEVQRSILSNRTHIRENAVVEDSLIFSGVQVGRGARVRKAIVDKWVKIPDGEEIGYDQGKDALRFTVTESGITVVPRGYQF